jgi:hypothetical protein
MRRTAIAIAMSDANRRHLAQPESPAEDRRRVDEGIISMHARQERRAERLRAAVTQAIG